MEQQQQQEKPLLKPFKFLKNQVYSASKSLGLSFYNYMKQSDKLSLQYSISRKVSRFSGSMSRMYIPKPLRQIMFGSYAEMYNVIQEDMLIKDFSHYENFQQFFTRKVKSRQIDANPNILVSPADSKILQISEIKGDENLLIKKVNYSLGEFLTGIDGYKLEGELFESLKKNNKKESSKLYQIIFYLNPGDYHRYHVPTDILIKRAWHIAGHLAPVKENYIGSKPKVYETNERINCVGEYHQGFMSMVLVGATNVGSMTLNFDKDMKTNQKLENSFQKCVVTEYDKKSVHQRNQDKYQEKQQQKDDSEDDEIEDTDSTNEDLHQFIDELQPPYIQEEKGISVPKGEELGMFKLGSTVVLIFEVSDDIKFLAEPGDKIRYGQPFAEIIPKQE